MPRKFWLFAAAIVTAFLATTVPSALAAAPPVLIQSQSGLKSGSFAQLKMSSTDTDVSDGSLEITLSVNSTTDMLVPGASVVLTTCAMGQTVPFHFLRTRHLVPDQEKLRAFNGGRAVEWWMAGAPANDKPPRQLNLKLKLPQGTGAGVGPNFCVTAWASTSYDEGPGFVHKLDWWFEVK